QHLRHHRRRAVELDARLRAVPLSERVPVLPHGLRVGNGLDPDAHHRCRARPHLPHVRLGLLRGTLLMGSRRAWRNGIVYVVLVVGAVFFLTPFAWMLSTSLKPDEQVFTIPPEWIPAPVMWSNYARLLTEIPFLRYLGTTGSVTVLSVTLYVAS